MGRGIRFTTEFKREAVRLALTSGRPRAEIAEDLGDRKALAACPGVTFRLAECN